MTSFTNFTNAPLFSSNTDGPTGFTGFTGFTASNYSMFSQNQTQSMNPSIYAPLTNIISTSGTGTTGVIQNASYSLFDAFYESGAVQNYFKAGSTFMLLSSILDSAPAFSPTGPTGSIFYPQLSMSYQLPNICGVFTGCTGTFTGCTGCTGTFDPCTGLITGVTGCSGCTGTVTGCTGTSSWIVQLTLSAGGRAATSPVFQTNASQSGQLNFILTNFFQITMPGIIYTITIEGNYITNNQLVP